jgi:hypothetical protein
MWLQSLERVGVKGQNPDDKGVASFPRPSLIVCLRLGDHLLFVSWRKSDVTVKVWKFIADKEWVTAPDT